MEDATFGFILILLVGFAVSLAVTVCLFFIRQRKLARLKDPRHDYYR